jgi:YbgC/YbaW family acyl-CoA thioester hydrolase
VELSRIVATRRSLRAFSDRPVESVKIERLIEAARWSPSNGNRQPWRFVIVEKGDPARASVEEALDPGNAWAKRAPVLIITGGRKVAGTVVETREYFIHDPGLALMSILYKAVDQGLLAHPMAGWKEVPLRTALALPDDVVPLAVVAVGYRGRLEDLDEAARGKDERPNIRKAIGEIAFRGRWGEPLPKTLPEGPARMFETGIPIRFRDLDAMGHVNNAVTLTFIEIGRLRFFAEVLGVRRVEDIGFILAETICRYRIPILLQDDVRVRMHVTDVSRSSFRFRYELFDPGDGRIFADAETVQVSYDYKKGIPRPFPQEVLEKIGEYIGG